MAGTDALRRHLHVTVYNGRDFEQDTAVVMHVSVRANEVLQLQTSAQDNIDGNFESPCWGAPRDKSGRLLRLVGREAPYVAGATKALRNVRSTFGIHADHVEARPTILLAIEQSDRATRVCGHEP
jgi:hypothetical protein